MKARLLSTVAASLLIGVGVASAQSMNQNQAPERAPSAQQKAPAEKMAPPINEHKGGSTTGQASPDSKSERGAAGTMNKPEKAGEQSGQKGSETSGQAPKAGEHEKSGGSMKNSEEGKGAAPKGTTGQNRNATETKPEMNKNATETNKPGGRGAASESNKTPNNAQGAGSATTGQGAASGQAKLSTEQRTRITTVIRSQKVERVEPSQLHVSINVGSTIPSTVRVHPLPQEVVVIYPEWRGYDYILVGDQILVINPRTHEIVAILEA